MRYTERPIFPYDAEVFKLRNVQLAIRIYDEATRKHSARPTPTFLEVNRSIEKLDPLWHAPAGGREEILRKLEIPAIDRFPNGKNEWVFTPAGVMSPQRRDDFTLSHKSLIEFDYFPVKGDYVFYNGYLYMVTTVSIPGEAYWAQTNVWLGLEVKCMIPPVGDGRPIYPTPDMFKTQLPLPSLSDTIIGSKSPPDDPQGPI